MFFRTFNSFQPNNKFSSVSIDQDISISSISLQNRCIVVALISGTCLIAVEGILLQTFSIIHKITQLANDLELHVVRSSTYTEIIF